MQKIYLNTAKPPSPLAGAELRTDEVRELYPKKWTKNPLVYDRLKKKGYRE